MAADRDVASCTVDAICGALSRSMMVAEMEHRMYRYTSCRTHSCDSALHSRARIATLIALLALLAASACGFPKPPNVGDDGAGDDMPGDAGSTPAANTVVHVSATGNDASDGVTSPVKTIQRAIAIAVGNSNIVQIALAAGDYSTSSGESFPYTVPPSVTIAGPTGGGAVLSGDKTSTAVALNASGLQDLELQDFTTAITVTGTANLKNVLVATSPTAVQVETTGMLSVDNLTISGTPGACGTGIVLEGAASLVARTLETHNLQATLDARDQSATDISNAMLTGDSNCAGALADLNVASSASFHLADSVLDGGLNGIGIVAKAASFQAVLTNTVVRNMKQGALGGGFGGVAASFHMTGGELSNTTGTGVSLGPGLWTFTGVTLKQNRDVAIYLQDGSLVMRGCTVTGNGLGIDVFSDSTADLGTMDSAGNNVFQNNTGVAVWSESGIGAGGIAVNAVGNTWNPNVQGTDSTGAFSTTATIVGPVNAVDGNNYAVDTGCRLSR